MNHLLSGAGLALVAHTTLSLSNGPAQAIVYCKTVGVPQGCVVRPVAPVARAVARAGVGAPGVGVRRGTSNESWRPRQSSRETLKELSMASAFNILGSAARVVATR